MKRLILVCAGMAVVVAGVSGIRSLEWMPDPSGGYVVPDLGPLSTGQIHWGEGRYIEYIVGEPPLILSAPHGGTLTPSEIRDRTRGYTIGDSDTQELTRLVAQALVDLTGHTPHGDQSPLSEET